MKNNILKNYIFSVWFIGFLFVVAVGLLYLVIQDVRNSAEPGEKTPVVDKVIRNQAKINDEVETPIIPVAEISKDRFRAEVPTDVVVPGMAAQLTAEQAAEIKQKEIAVPLVVAPAAPGAVSQFRNFQINAVGGVFTPSKIIVNKGDTVHLNFTAVDGDYDLFFPSYNMSQRAKQGQSKILEFQATSDGDFIYYCAACGGPDKGPLGHIIVVP